MTNSTPWTVTAKCDALTEIQLSQLEAADIEVTDHSSGTDNPGGASTLQYTFSVAADDEETAADAVREALAGAHPTDIKASTGE